MKFFVLWTRDALLCKSILALQIKYAEVLLLHCIFKRAETSDCPDPSPKGSPPGAAHWLEIQLAWLWVFYCDIPRALLWFATISVTGEILRSRAVPFNLPPTCPGQEAISRAEKAYKTPLWEILFSTWCCQVFYVSLCLAAMASPCSCKLFRAGILLYASTALCLAWCL